MRPELLLRDRGGTGRRDGALETESRGQGECYFLGGDHSSRWAGAVVPVAAVLTGGLFGRGGQARSRGSERMLRTLKVSDSRRGLGSRGGIVIYWLLQGVGSSWPEFEVTVTSTDNGNFCALIFTLHKLCSMHYANTTYNLYFNIYFTLLSQIHDIKN